jgi:hypothetical protein
VRWLAEIPSGKRSHNYGKSPFLMGKSTNYKWTCSIAMWMFTRGYTYHPIINQSSIYGFPNHHQSMIDVW